MDKSTRYRTYVHISCLEELELTGAAARDEQVPVSLTLVADQVSLTLPILLNFMDPND